VLTTQDQDMIHTITLNPTLDLTYVVDDFREDDTTRARAMYRAPGGKGVNVSRVAKRLGHPTIALGLIAGNTGLEVTELLEAEGVNTWFTPLPAGQTRTNPILQTHSGKHIRVSGIGPKSDPDALQSLWDSVFALRAPDYLVISGSRLEGTPDDFYVRLVQEARRQGIRAVIDADGKDLRDGVQAGAALIKPNRHELERLAGRTLGTLDEVVGACRQAISQGVETVAVSLGREGALLVTASQTVRAVPPEVQVQSPVGAGDSFLAGLCARLAEGLEPVTALKFGVACGTATAMMPGTSLCTMNTVLEVLENVKTERLE
jgi:6-phosphofructokinase 2